MKLQSKNNIYILYIVNHTSLDMCIYNVKNKKCIIKNVYGLSNALSEFRFENI